LLPCFGSVTHDANVMGIDGGCDARGQAETAIRTGALVAERSGAASPAPDTAATAHVARQQLESAKEIEVEERIMSPGPAGSTRSRQAAAAARAATPAAAHDVPGASARGSTPTGATPRQASPARSASTRGAAEAATGRGGAEANRPPHPHPHMRVQIMVPRGKMGLLIGAQGKTIRELLHEAKTLRAHIQVPCMTAPEDGGSGEVSVPEARRRNSGLVVITGPRDGVLVLKEKVASIIAGQACAGSHDPLAYIAPYVQGAAGSSAAPKEARRLLQLIQKLSTPSAGSGADPAPDPSSMTGPQEEGARVEAPAPAQAGQQDQLMPPDDPDPSAGIGQVAPALTVAGNGQPRMAAPWAAARGDGAADRDDEARRSDGGAGNDTYYVDQGAFGSRLTSASAAHHRRALQPSSGVWPHAPVLAAMGRGVGASAAAAAAASGAHDMSALRFKLQHVTQGLATVTRALGQLSMDLPAELEAYPSLEPYPSEIGRPVVLTSGAGEHGTFGAPLVIFSWRCLQHRVEEGMQEHPGRLEALFGAQGVLVQVSAGRRGVGGGAPGPACCIHRCDAVVARGGCLLVCEASSHLLRAMSAVDTCVRHAQEPLRSMVMFEQWDQMAPLSDILRVHEVRRRPSAAPDCTVQSGAGCGRDRAPSR
jgi:hypothetical protein